MNPENLKEFLDEKVAQYATKEFFIPTDPIQIPHSFSDPRDQEIAGFFSALIAWGQRKTIINNANKWMDLMDRSPYEFLVHAQPKEYEVFGTIVHRTLNGLDAIAITTSVAKIIKTFGSFDAFFQQHPGGSKAKIQSLHQYMVKEGLLPRTLKHFANPDKNSAAKRLNMFSRIIKQAKKMVHSHTFDT